MTRITPLDLWIRAKARIGENLTGAKAARALAAYQLEQLNRTIDHARCNSPFYRRHLACLPPTPLADLTEIPRLPFTTAADIAENPLRLLAVRMA